MAAPTYELPDLQLRMSKKIAQLTKVIFQLNTKNEDHELDMQDMADAYEAEIEQMLRDAAEKLNAFKSQLEAARDDSRFQEAVAKVQLRYEQERQVWYSRTSRQACSVSTGACPEIDRTLAHFIQLHVATIYARRQISESFS